MYEMVNSASDFNENSFEQTKENKVYSENFIIS